MDNQDYKLQELGTLISGMLQMGYTPQDITEAVTEITMEEFYNG